MTMTYAPIVLFVYNRPEHTVKTVDALKKNLFANTSILYIFSDAPKTRNEIGNVMQVRAFIHKIDGFKKVEIHENDTNRGLANSILWGVTKVLSKHDRVIVLEDDCVSSQFFLPYVNQSLEKYKNETKVFSICGYNLPDSLLKIPKKYLYGTYFSYRFYSQGWATWKDRWEKTDWDASDYKEIKHSLRKRKAFNRGGPDRSDRLIRNLETDEDAWAIRFQYAHFKHHAYTLCPVISFINNIGWDGTGVHCGSTDKYRNDLSKCKYPVTYSSKIAVDKNINRTLHNALYQSFSQKLKRILIFYLKYLKVYPIVRIIFQRIRPIWPWTQ